MTKFVQWVANNVDHNIRTLTGKGTFHGMEIIAITSSRLKYDAIKRSKHNNNVDLSATLVKITPSDGFSFNGLFNVNLRPTKTSHYKEYMHLKQTLIKCRCKSSSKSQLGTILCFCKKNSLTCMSACGECHKEDCNNRKVNKLSIYSGIV